jgi:uncharacterized protein YceH (UPF0502 family)
MNLSASEIRVLGCLLEKQRTTPDAYPLSLNALRLACNQSTNRDPVVEYDDAVLRDALHRLERRGYTRLASGAGSRTPKYRHLLAEALPMARDEQAVMCVLMLRGAQTPGELKQRTERMSHFADLGAVHETIGRLIERGLVARLERRPGQKEERYAQLLEDTDALDTPVAAGNGTAGHHAPAYGSSVPQVQGYAAATPGAPGASEHAADVQGYATSVPASVHSAPGASVGTPSAPATPRVLEDRPAQDSAGADASAGDTVAGDAAAAVSVALQELAQRVECLERELGKRVTRLERDVSGLQAELGVPSDPGGESLAFER